MMADDDPYGLRKKSYTELVRWTGGWRVGTESHIAGQQELARRAGQQELHLSKLAIRIAVGSFVVAVLSLSVALYFGFVGK